MSKNINTKDDTFEELKNHTVLELIKDRFYLVSCKSEKPKLADGIHIFTMDEDEIDTLDLSTIAKILKKINIVLSTPEFTSKLLVCWSSGSEMRRRNVSVCVGVFALVYLGKDCAELGRMLTDHSTISISEPLSAVHRALNRGFINFYDFNEDVFNGLGDVRLHWIVPRKILGCYGPLYFNDKNYVGPRRYLNYFRQVGVKTIVRVRHLKWDANPFIDVGLDHYDLNMVESVPSDRALDCFLQCCEAEPESPVVVHCREFLGRLGCLAAAYLMKHHGMSAEKAMGWIRICTPDCFLESQKVWLRKKQKSLRIAGSLFRTVRIGFNGKMIGQAGNRGICSYTGLSGATADLKEVCDSGQIVEKPDKEIEHID